MSTINMGAQPAISLRNLQSASQSDWSGKLLNEYVLNLLKWCECIHLGMPFKVRFDGFLTSIVHDLYFVFVGCVLC
jgi:hypothetical protein